MAGTGHSYEIANVAEVRTFIDSFLQREDPVSVVSWFHNKKFLRYLTSEPFTTKISAQNAVYLEGKVEEDELPFITRKLEEGKDVRVFTPQAFKTFGCDVIHLKDWAVCYANDNSQAKLAKFTAEQAITASKKWVYSASRKITNDGKTSYILTTEKDFVWVELIDHDALRAEGSAMSHCVGLGSYDEGLSSGSDRFFSLREDGKRPLITVQIRKSSTGLTLWQAKGFGNASVQYRLLDCLVMLMKHLGVSQNSVNGCPSLVARDGDWLRLDQAWDRSIILDHEVYTHNSKMAVMSRRVPGDLLLHASRDTYGNWYFREPDRHLHIDELRDICLFCDKYPGKHTPGQIIYDDESNTHKPIYDFWARRVINGVECYVHTVKQSYKDDEIIYVPHSGDGARILLEIGPERSLKYAKYPYHADRYESSLECAFPVNTERWNKTEAQRMIAVMNDTACHRMVYSRSDPGNIKTKYDPVRTPDGRWHLFALDHQLSMPETLDRGVWKHNDYLARFESGHSSIRIERNIEGFVVGFHTMVPYDGHVREATAFLNKLGWKAKTFCYGLGLSRYVADQKNFGSIYFLRDEWHYAETLDEAVALVTSRPKGKRKVSFNLIEAEFVIRGLSRHVGYSEALDEALRTALWEWLKSTKKIDTCSLDFYKLSEHLDRQYADVGSYQGRHALCQKLFDLSEAAIMKRFTTLTNQMMKEYLRGKPLYSERGGVTSFFFENHTLLKEPLFIRGLKFVTGKSGMNTMWRREIGPPVSLHEVYKRACDFGYGHRFSSSAYYATLCLPKEIKDLEELNRWVECLEIGARYRGVSLLDRAQEMRGLALGVDSGEDHIARIDKVVKERHEYDAARLQEEAQWREKLSYPL